MGVSIGFILGILILAIGFLQALFVMFAWWWVMLSGMDR